jgi:hypothetical protein
LAALVIAFRTDGLLVVTAGADAAAAARGLWIAEITFSITVAVLAVTTAALVATDVVRLFRR